MAELSVSEQRELKIALSRMCYREVQPGRWMKPVGFHSFTADIVTGEWTHHMVRLDTNRVSVYRRKLVRTLADVKEAEAYSESLSRGSTLSSFELTPDADLIFS